MSCLALSQNQQQQRKQTRTVSPSPNDQQQQHTQQHTQQRQQPMLGMRARALLLNELHKKAKQTTCLPPQLDP
jgi:hypothetical protein